MPPSRIAPPIPPTTPPMTFFEEEESPPDPPPLLPAWSVGVVTMVAKPVVLARTSEDVDVTRVTCPLLPVLEMTVETSRVEDATRADVMVVFAVLLFVGEVACAALVLAAPAPPPPPPALEESVSDVGVDFCEVVVVTDVDREVIVVGVPSDVVTEVSDMTDDDVMVVLCAAPPDPEPESVVGEAGVPVAPVPKSCLLWKMPSSIGLSSGLLVAAAEAAKAIENKATERRIFALSSVVCTGARGDAVCRTSCVSQAQGSLVEDPWSSNRDCSMVQRVKVESPAPGVQRQGTWMVQRMEERRRRLL